MQLLDSNDAKLAANLADIINKDCDLKKQPEGMVLQRAKPVATPIKAAAVPALRTNAAVLASLSEEHKQQLNQILGNYGQQINPSLLISNEVQVEGQVQDTGAQQQAQQQQQQQANEMTVEGQVLDTAVQRAVGNQVAGDGSRIGASDQNSLVFCFILIFYPFSVFYNFYFLRILLIFKSIRQQLANLRILLRTLLIFVTVRISK